MHGTGLFVLLRLRKLPNFRKRNSELKVSYRLNAFQLILLFAIICTLVFLTVLTGDISRGASKDVNLFSSAELASTSLLFAQRESLAYTTRFAQWVGGEVDRRDVQIARALLAQRLNVITSSNLTSGALFSQDYFKNLDEADKILATAHPGILPRSEAKTIELQSKAFIDSMLIETRKLVVVYQNNLDLVLAKAAVDRRHKAEQSLFVLLLFLALALIFFASLIFTLVKQYRANTKANVEQLRLITEANMQLSQSRMVVDQLEILDERKNIFITTVNHELRTPLTSIVGYIEILRSKLEGMADAELIKIIEVLERNSNNLLNLVQDILSLTNLETGASGLLKSENDVIEIINDAILSLTPLAEASHISITLSVEAGLQTAIHANRNQFSEIITNLLSNAIKFSKDGSSVRVHIDKGVTNKPTKMLRISVSDQGIGIPELELENVFSSFFRASNARKSGISGTGLGLAIVSRIVEEHHGSITVESTLNVGTTFRVEVPIYVSEIDEYIDSHQIDVLVRAIVAIETSTISDLRNVCHEMIGVLGFYGLESMGSEISKFSTWLKANETTEEDQIFLRRDKLLEVLGSCLTQLRDTKEI